MRKYRFYRVDGVRVSYVDQDQKYFVDRRHAGVFTEADWETWGKEVERLQREPLGEDEVLRRSGAASLPGLEE